MRALAPLVLALLSLPAALPALAAPEAPEPLLRLPEGAEDGNPATWSEDPSVRVVPYRLGLNFPVAMQFMDDGRLYYGEWQTGRVNLVASPGGPVQTILDLDVLTGGEMGLHEVDIRNVDGTDYLYVSYVYGSDSYWGCILCRDHLSRFEMLSSSTLGPEQVLLDLQGGFVHNGGIINWGPLDGKLYYSRGDASFAGLSQEVNGWTGRMLRLNPDGTIPADNPMGPDNPTYAYGLRHTFGADFLPGTQVLVGTENSDYRADEVNVILPGRNYGWPVTVGFDRILEPEQYFPPVRVFERTIGPTNGHFYLGTQVPQWFGQYFYGDTNNGIIYRLVPDVTHSGPGAPPEVVIDTPYLVVDITTGPDGYLYFSRPEGIYRVEPVLVDPGLPGTRLGPALDGLVGTVLGLLPDLPLP